MALDTSNDHPEVLNLLIDGIEQSLGDLAIQVFPDRAKGVHTPDWTGQGRSVKTATGQHAHDIQVATDAITGLAGDLMMFMEDGTLPQTGALMDVLDTLMALKGTGDGLLVTFREGNSIKGDDLPDLEAFLTTFGETLMRAREVGSEAAASARSDAQTTPEAVAPTNGGGEADGLAAAAEGSQTEPAERSSQTTQPPLAPIGQNTAFVYAAPDAEMPPGRPSDGTGVSKPASAVSPEPAGLSLTDVTIDAQDLLTEIEDLNARIVELMTDPFNTRSNQLADVVDFSTLLDRGTALFEEVENIISETVEILADSETISVSLSEKRDALEDLVELVEAIEATRQVPETGSVEAEEVGDPQPAEAAGYDMAVDEGPEASGGGEAGSDGGASATTAMPDSSGRGDDLPADSGLAEMVDSVSAGSGPDGSPEPEAIRAGEMGTGADMVGDAANAEVANESAEPAAPAEPEEPPVTITDVMREAQAVLTEFDTLEGELLDLISADYDTTSTRLEDGVNWAPLFQETLDRTRGIGAQIRTLTSKEGGDLTTAMTALSEQQAHLTDVKDFIASIKATRKDAGGAESGNGPAPSARSEVTVATQDLLDRLDALDTEILGLMMAPYDPSSPSLDSGVLWSTYLTEVDKMKIDLRSEVLDKIMGPEPDIEGANALLAETETYVANLEDFVGAMQGGDSGEAEGAAAAKSTDDTAPTNDAAPTDGAEGPAPVSRSDLVDQAEALLGDISKLNDTVFNLMTAEFDPDAVKPSNLIDWSGFREELDPLQRDLISDFPGLLAGNIESGEFSKADRQKALEALQEKSDAFGAIKDRIDSILAADDLLAPLAVEMGRVWGDPHFVGADGGKYDVQGQAGNFYNILSDDGLQVNARFDQFGREGSGKTVMGSIGITLGDNKVRIDKSGELFINDEQVGEGTYLDGVVTLGVDGVVHISEEEYSFSVVHHVNRNGNYLNIENIRSDDAAADGILPSGLWGVTVDYDEEARSGDQGGGTQGGGAIEALDGSITERGDTTTVQTYEVGSLFDTDFDNHNRFDAA